MTIDPVETKTCTKCGESKPLDEFHVNRSQKSGRRSQCAVCSTKNTKRHYTTNLSYMARSLARSRRKNGEGYFRRNLLWQRYGITQKTYDVMLSYQGGRCAICRSSHSGENRPLAVDHDHETGEIRGLLCHLCNRGLGAFGDNLEGLMRAVGYLKNPIDLVKAYTAYNDPDKR